MNKQFDIFIPIAPKDFNKLKFLVRSIEENLEGWNHIYVTSPEGTEVMKHNKISYYKDKDILNIDPLRFKYRPGWLYQMYLKMFQNVTELDNYVTFDSDLIINRPIKMFTQDSEERFIWYLGWEQNHEPYFRFQRQILNLPRIFPHTFINDMNSMKKSIIQEMLQRNGFTVESFCEKSFEIITPDCYPAEPEIVGQYITKYHREKYCFKEAKTLCNPKVQDHISDISHQIWSDEEIESEIQKMKSQDYDFIMLHSWLNNNIYNWS